MVLVAVAITGAITGGVGLNANKGSGLEILGVDFSVHFLQSNFCFGSSDGGAR